eukprot:PhM_4_TR4030/c0_g1_i1/m.89699
MVRLSSTHFIYLFVLCWVAFTVLGIRYYFNDVMSKLDDLSTSIPSSADANVKHDIEGLQERLFHAHVEHDECVAVYNKWQEQQERSKMVLTSKHNAANHNNNNINSNNIQAHLNSLPSILTPEHILKIEQTLSERFPKSAAAKRLYHDLNRLRQRYVTVMDLHKELLNNVTEWRATFKPFIKAMEARPDRMLYNYI